MCKRASQTYLSLHNQIYTSLLSVGRYPALIWQPPMNAMCWQESRIVNGQVIIHPAETGVLFLQKQVERISRIILWLSFQLVLEDKELLAQKDG